LFGKVLNIPKKAKLRCKPTKSGKIDMKLSYFFITYFLVFSIVCTAQKNMPTKITVRPKGTGTQWIGKEKYETQFRQPFDGYRLLGVGFGTANYYGDFTTYKLPMATIVKNTRWNIGIHYSKYFTQKIAMRLGVSAIRLTGDDDNFKNGSVEYLSKYSRGLHFRNTLREANLVGVYDFTSFYKGGYTRRQDVVPFVFAGIALANHNPQGRAPTVGGVVQNKWEKLRQFDTEGQSDVGRKQYSTIALSVPVGMGIRFKINNDFDFSVEGRLNYTINEGGKYLDDISGDYVSSARSAVLSGNANNSELFSFRANEPFAARTGNVRDFSKITLPQTQDTGGLPTQRGNGRQDVYFISVFQLNYYLPAPLRCRGN
jgi:hypothetical protein